MTTEADVDGANIEDETAKPNVDSEQRDRDVQGIHVSSLEVQVDDLFSQVTQLNNKLVQSYDRVSDLEDKLHYSSANERSSSLRIAQLELERSQHLSAINTGLLVEKAHVTSELNRLMEKATEEAARRGQAETARHDIEKDLDDLSASLFAQANSMVAEARLQRADSERKVQDAEQALRGAEEAVSLMQSQMQTLQAERELAAREMEEIRRTMNKGKWKERDALPSDPTTDLQLHLRKSHVPYIEFLSFLTHVRKLRTTLTQSPALPPLLSQPFLARIVSEDSDPTLRLDLAPSLNWLTRRAVVSAIHAGQLIIEPASTTALLTEVLNTSPLMSGNSMALPCALCGTSAIQSTTASGSPQQASNWSSSLFRGPSSPNNSAPQTPTGQIPHQIHVFRLATPPTSVQTGSMTPSSRPTSYPLCSGGWCLTRLRATCSLWAFVRTEVIHHVWESEPAPRASNPEQSAGNLTVGAPPSLPPRRRSKLGVGNLWGMAQGALGMERSPSRSESPTQGFAAKLSLPSLSLLGSRSEQTPTEESPKAQVTPTATSSRAKPISTQRSASEAITDGAVNDKLSPERPSDIAPVPSPSHAPLEPQASSSMTKNEISGSVFTTTPTQPPDSVTADIEEVAQAPGVELIHQQSDETAGTAAARQEPADEPKMVSAPVKHESLDEAVQVTPPVEADSPVKSPVSAAPPPVPRRAAARTRAPRTEHDIPSPVEPSREGKTQLADSTVEKPAETASNAMEPTQESRSTTSVGDHDDSKASLHQDSDAPLKDQITDRAPRVKTDSAAAADYNIPSTAEHSSTYSKPTPSPSKPDPIVTDSDFAPPIPPRGRHHKMNGDTRESHHPDLIGTMTWEERTWRELARLRSEMFRARMGDF